MPRITISISSPDDRPESEIVTLDIPPGFTVGETKELIKSETKHTNHSPQFFLNGQVLSNDEKTLEDAGIKDGEMLAMLISRSGTGPAGQRQQQQQQQRRRRQQDTDDVDIETARLNLLGNPQALSSIQEQQPDLAAAINDPIRFRDAWQSAINEERNREKERQDQMALLNEDPLNIDAQRKIEEIIRNDRVTENLQAALDYNPESFGRVNMLYINTEVNGHPVKALVDSGAQATIMSPDCAEKCGIMRLIDRRFQNIARGVGTALILGRVHYAQIKLGNAVLPAMFTVMEGKEVDLLLGLDMLKRYQACIDLKKNMLIFEGNEVPFLPESEIPKHYEEAQLNEPTLEGPNGTEIGAKSGAVRPAGSTAAAQNVVAMGAPGASNSQNPAPTKSTQPAPPPNVSQEAVAQLQGLGFSKGEATEALRATDGDIEQAASLLFQR